MGLAAKCSILFKSKLSKQATSESGLPSKHKARPQTQLLVNAVAAKDATKVNQTWSGRVQYGVTMIAEEQDTMLLLLECTHSFTIICKMKYRLHQPSQWVEQIELISLSIIHQ